MEEAWTAHDVYLLTAGAEGQVAVPHLLLTFLASGLQLDKADGGPVWESTWDELEEMSPVGRSVLPDGRDGVVVVVVERDRGTRHRFVLTTDDPTGTEASIRRRAAARGLRTRTPRPAVSRALTASLAVLALATLTVLLLSAAHVIHF